MVYTLKNISNAFYFACLIYKQNIQIYKYSYETKSFKNIGKIDVISSYFASMKYFYNPLNKQEYFFVINDIDELEIYLIKNESNFELIQKLNYINDEDKNNNNNNNIINIDDDDSINSMEGGATFTNFNFLDIFYNENDKNVYFIISYLIMQNAGGSMSSLDYYNSKSNNIFTFKDGKLNLIKTFKFDIDFIMNNLIYMNNDSDKKYLIDAHEKNNLILIELKSNYDNYEIENFFNDDNHKNKLNNFIRSQFFYKTCLIYGKNNFDYLYIFEGNQLMIINFTEKNVDKIIDFNQTYLRNIHNWNNNYIIFFQYGKIDIYDTNNNKFITEHKKKNCRGFISHSFPDKNEALGIFKYYDKIECYFV